MGGCSKARERQFIGQDHGRACPVHVRRGRVSKMQARFPETGVPEGDYAHQLMSVRMYVYCMADLELQGTGCSGKG